MRSRDRITLGALLAALALAVFAIGGAPRWSVVALAGLAATAAAGQIGSRRKLQGWSPLLIVLGTMIVLTLLQLVPMPEIVLKTINPTGYGLLVDGVQLSNPDAHEPARSAVRQILKGPWRPLSLDPASTRVELAKFCAYFLLAWMALRAAASDRGRQRLLSAVAALAGSVAVVGIIHELLGADRLFGFYTPVHANPLVMAPLLNPNHLACLMVIGALTAAGLAVNERRAPPIRALWIVVTIMCIGVGLATRSRGGVMALGAGATVAAVVMVLQQLRASAETRRADVLRVAIPAAVIVLCTLVLVVYFGGSVQQELEHTRLDELSDPRSKYEAWRSAITLIEEAPVLGVGRGAFQSAFSRVHPQSSQVTFSHLENEYLQAVVDWGLLGGIALAIALGLAVILAVRRWKDGPLTAAAIGALTGVGVQSLVDFGLELPGIAVPTLLIASTLLHVPLVETSRKRKRRVGRIAAVLATLAVGALAATPLARTLANDHAILREGSSLVKAKAAFARHPLDYLAAAHIATASPEPRQRIAYLNHALRLHPTHSGLHRIIGAWLAGSGHLSQAAIEYKVALSGSDAPEALVDEIVTRFPRAEDAAKALPGSHRMWQRIVKSLTDRKRPDIALLYMSQVVDSRPEVEPRVWRTLFNLALQQGDLVVASRAERQLLKVEAGLANTLRLAQLQIRLLKYDDALATLARANAQEVSSSEHVDTRLLVCEIHVTRIDWIKARDCFNAVRLGPSVTLAVRRRIHARLAAVEDALGNKERAEFERKLGAGADATPAAGSATTP